MGTVLIFEVISDKFILVEIFATGNSLGTWNLAEKLHEYETFIVNECVSLVLRRFNHREIGGVAAQ
jgi:hypothetical protein